MMEPKPDVYFGPTLELIPDLSGKCYAITGCTSGTGLWTAIAAARKGAACIIMLNRKSKRVQAAEAKIKAEVKGMTKVVPVECDLQSFDSVRAAAKESAVISSQYGGIDGLLNNAGIMGVPDKRTVDGFDVQMQTNHLSHFLLYTLLKPSLEAAAASRGESRVIQHSSGARALEKHLSTDGAGNDGNLEAKYMTACAPGTLGGDELPACFNRYHQTKLANTVFAMALHQQLVAAGSKIKSLVAEPGVAQTDLGGNLAKLHLANGNQQILEVMGGMLSQFKDMQSCADGACCLMMAAFSKEANGGDFWMPETLAGICAIGMPMRCVTAGVPTPGGTPSGWQEKKYENERLTMNKANWTTLMAASEAATATATATATTATATTTTAAQQSASAYLETEVDPVLAPIVQALVRERPQGQSEIFRAIARLAASASAQ